MQHDLEQATLLASIQDSDTAENEVTAKRPALKVAPPADERQSPYSADDFGKITRKLWATRRQRPSPMMWRLSLMIGDIVLLAASLALVFVIAPYLHLGLHITWNEPATWDLKFVWACIALASWGVAVNITHAQDLVYASNRMRSSLSVTYALVLMLISWMMLIYPFIAGRATSYAAVLPVLLLFLVVAVPVLNTWRIALAEFMNLPHFRPQGVIVGVNAAAETIARELGSVKRPTVDVLGFISESTDEQVQRDGLSVLGGKNTLRGLIDDDIIDTIITAIDYKANPELFQEAIEAAQLGISVLPMTMVYERTCGKIPVEHIGDQWYVALPSEHMISPLYLGWHKAMDVVFGLFGTLILCLIFPLMALLISLDSSGPIFYKQERLGYHGEKFYIFKFRSMRTGAERVGSAMWSGKGDPRVTRVGRFLRATHLDELPQVLNILRGEMSLIGPRPERQAFVNHLEKTIPFYRCRLGVKPGLTGWAQVKYPYGRTSDDALAKLQYDLYYIKHRSVTLDVLIILRTVVEVLLSRGV